MHLLEDLLAKLGDTAHRTSGRVIHFHEGRHVHVANVVNGGTHAELTEEGEAHLAELKAKTAMPKRTRTAAE